MQRKIRLIAMDMDGTLLGERTDRIPEENAAALREAADRGIELALCSGRIPDDAGFFALDAGLPMHILALNGCCCMDEPLGPIIDSRCFDESTARQVKEMLDAADCLYGIFGEHTLVTNWTEEQLAPHDILWGTHMNREGGRTRTYYGGGNADELIRQGVNKFVAVKEGDLEGLARLRGKLEALPGIEISSSWVNNIEINQQGMNKGSAVAELARRLHIPIEQVMTLGDNDNDIPMLACAGCGVVMANGTPGAKAAADYVTLTNTENGVAAAIRALAFGEQVDGVRRLK